MGDAMKLTMAVLLGVVLALVTLILIVVVSATPHPPIWLRCILGAMGCGWFLPSIFLIRSIR